MEIKVIDGYIEEVLEKRLIEFELKEKYIKNICDDVKEQMLSLLFHWNDVKFRKAILMIGLEEGKFYLPDVNVDVNSFIVVTVRNSFIEIIFSDESKKMELDKPLPEEDVKKITTDAINYFKDINFEQLADEVSKNNIKDKYGEITKKYPMAWEALIQLGNCNGKKAVYKEIQIAEKIKLDFLNGVNSDVNQLVKESLEDVQSGINEKSSQNLLENLKFVLADTGPTVFFTDSFKMVTRNFEKLMKILEILLENNKTFLTCNYFITSSYIAKRQNMYKAAHVYSDVRKKINDSDFLVRTIKNTYDGIKKFGSRDERLVENSHV
ncbi:MAG: hypothetical protein IJ215_02285 [Clostridia bacterium]|nr:hypothetical protein [Clostridia bacterium]